MTDRSIALRARIGAGRDARVGAATAAALVTVTLWASAFVGIRSAGRSLSPGALSLGRLLVGCVVLRTLLYLRHERLPTWNAFRPVLPGVLTCGILWFGVYSVLLNAGERRVDAGTAAMLVNVGPILIAFLAGAFLREGYPRTLLAGCVVAFGGVAVIALATAGRGTTTVAGVLLCLAAAFAYSAAAVAQKPVLRTLSPLQTTFLCCAVGTVVCLPFAPALAREAATASAGALAWVAYLSAFPTAIAFSTWAFALARTSAGRLAAVTYLVPPISVLLGWLLLGETPAALAYLGGALCLIGVAITRRRPRSRAPRAATSVPDASPEASAKV